MQKRNEGERCAVFQLSLDLIVEILKKLPSKSLVRFRCVSKQWSSIICSRRDFIKAIVTRSLPQLRQQPPLFIFHHNVPDTFFTVSTTFSESIKPAVSISGSPDHYCSFLYQHVRGLFCCHSLFAHLVTIYNPTTRQSVRLPEIPTRIELQQCDCYFGYDPVMDQYKVLSVFLDLEEYEQTFYVFTLEQGQDWRSIQGIDDKKLVTHVDGVCIDGTIYFGATRWMGKNNFGETFSRADHTVLLSFDIRSERFYHVGAPKAMLKELSSCVAGDRTLLNHQGKLGCIGCSSEDTSMWVMENAEKQEWSKFTFALPPYPLDYIKGCFKGFSGVTPAGEIFASEHRYYMAKTLYVYYYDMNQNSFRRVEIQGTRAEGTTARSYSIKDRMVKKGFSPDLVFIWSRASSAPLPIPPIPFITVIEHKENQYTKSADVFSFGIVLWEMLTEKNTPEEKSRL